MFQEKVFRPNPVGYIETCGHSFSVANSAWKLLLWWIGELEVCFLMGGNSAEHDHLFLISKTKQPNHRKIDPQLVTGTTCYLPPSPTYLATWPLEKCPVWRFSLQALVVHQVTENFLPEGPVTIGITSGASGFPPVAPAWVMTLVVKKRNSNKIATDDPNLRNKFGGWGSLVTATIVLFPNVFFWVLVFRNSLRWFLNNYWELLGLLTDIFPSLR